MCMSETPYYFNNGNYRLFGILYKPDNKDVKEGFIFCHPFAEEKLWTQRVMVNFARELMKKGYAVLRFDFMGHGDSEGNFSESSVQTRLEDIQIACEFLNTKIPNLKLINLLGLRFGATLAVLAVEKIKKINRLVLWDPIINGKDYMQELFRINLTTQTAVYKEIRYTRDALVKQLEEGKTVNIDGYEIAHDLYKQSTEINLLGFEPSFSGKCFIAQITRSLKKIKQEYIELGNRLNNTQIEIAVEYPFWKEIKVYYYQAERLFDLTLNWLKEEDN